MTANRRKLETRRLEAERLLILGTRQTDVADYMHVSRTCVSRWARRMKTLDGMRARESTGRKRKVSAALLREILRLTGGWTGASFSQAVYDAFGIRYDVDHCCRLLRELAPDRPIRHGRPRA
jgi:transposase